MSHDETTDLDIRPDPLLREALRAVEREPPMEEVDWTELRSTIRERAALPLARRRTPSTAARWARPLVPLAAAASVAMALWLGGLGADRGADDPGSSAARAASGGVTTEDVLRSEVSEQEFRLLVSGRTNPDALLLLAVEGS